MEKKPAELGTICRCDSTNKRPYYDGGGTYLKLRS